MLINKELHQFLCSKTDELTEEWYATLDKNKKGVYGSTDPAEVKKLREQNHGFHVHFCSMFEKEEADFLIEFDEWIAEVTNDDAHLDTPLPSVIEEFFRTQIQYLDLVGQYTVANKDKVTLEQVAVWNKAIVETISKIIQEYTVKSTEAASRRWKKQEDLMDQISAPVIRLSENTALLPLVGEINSSRSEMMFENAMTQATNFSISKLFIDISGVAVIDTMVANQIFQMISGLKLIGVETALSGISPVIAKTAVELGIDFKDIQVYSTLPQALK
ncbi:STAS domain-containing protein [Planomicrobium okeanokoites]|uniref:STAS domain-containing protein n=1 Tax=Planomicrobium okeanokoites TaxID=244 RepID=A0ABV7KPK1_PLAOK|nr:STAS domain-containing protein [Planomicrobium okeanokoites]TAA71334.1 STAS domain-containing protein [Planomicrobium okeanokoites]